MSSVFVTNLDDFISPAQACIVTTTANSKTTIQPEENASKKGKVGNRVIAIDSSTSEFEESTRIKPSIIKAVSKHTSASVSKTTATVSLSDCLACTGCVTTAETILIQEHSFDKLLAKLISNDADVVISLSPQSCASIALHLDLSNEEVFLKLASFFKTLGVKYVFDTTSGGDLSLLVTREEFLARHSLGRCGNWMRPATSSAYSSDKSLVYADDASTQVLPNSTTPLVGLPMLSSHCPGWVCYAEKNQPEAIPYMNTVKSAQEIIGAVLKFLVGNERGRLYYHVSVQPCFDKKLEATRKDFLDEASMQTEVDLVLSTQELLSLLTQQRGISTSTDREYLTSFPLDPTLGDDHIEAMFRSFSTSALELVHAADNSSSGGYAEYVFKYAAEQLLGLDLWSTALVYKEGRNADMATLSVQVEGRGELKFGFAYGFQNIQSIMLKMKRGQCDLDFVEVMACPSGCLNGGGQIRPEHVVTASESRSRVSELSRLFHGRSRQQPEDGLLYAYLTDQNLMDRLKPLVHTRYHAVPKLELVAPTGIKW